VGVASALLAYLLMESSGLAADADADGAGEPVERTSRIAPIERLVRAAHFDAAEHEARTLLSSGTLDRGEVAELYLQLGIIVAARLDEPGAVLAFRRALMLAPEIVLPLFAGPHIVQAFSRARGVVLAEPPLRTAVRVSQTAGGSPVRVEARVTGDATGIARQLRLLGASVEETRALSGGTLAVTVAVPAELRGCEALRASVLDEHGNEIQPSVGEGRVCAATAAVAGGRPVVAGGGAPAGVVARSGAPAGESARPIPLYVWAAAGVTAAGLLTAGGFALGYLQARSDYHRSLQDDGRSDADRLALRNDAVDTGRLAERVGLVTAGLAVTTTILYLTRPRRSANAWSVGLGPQSLSFHARF
jgi:hypothetical protein